MRQLRKLKDLSDFALQARDGEIGKFKDVYFDDESWVVRYLIVRTGGWLTGREVLISRNISSVWMTSIKIFRSISPANRLRTAR